MARRGSLTVLKDQMEENNQEGDQNANPYSKTTESSHKTTYEDIKNFLETSACHLPKHTEPVYIFSIGECDGNTLSSMKSSAGGTVNKCKHLDERTYEKALNKGDLIEFRKYNPENKESIAHKDAEGKAQSHWAVYIGSGTIAGPNTPYCVTTEIWKSINNTNTLKVVYAINEQDNNTDLTLKDSDALKSIVRIDDLFQVPKVQNAKSCQNNQMDEMLNSTKSSVRGTVNMCTQVDERTYKQELNKGDLIEISPYHSSTILYPPHSYPDNKQRTVHKHVDVKAQSHWAVYLGAGTDARPNTPCCVRMPSVTPTTDQTKIILIVVYPGEEQDSTTDQNLEDSDELKTIVRIDDLFQIASVQNAESYQSNPPDKINTPKVFYPTKVQNAKSCQNNQMDEMLNSKKSSVGRTVNMCTQLDERTYEEVLNKGDLIEFRPYHSFTIRYPPYSYPDNTKGIVHKDFDRKAQSHWAVYLGSGTVAHVAGPTIPYCVNVLREIPTTNQRMSLLKAVYPTTEQDNNTDLKLKKYDELKPIVRIDELFQVAKIQNAKPFQNNQMDEMFIAGTPDEIVNIAKYLVGITLPHDCITKDCKDFAVFCRYGENLRSLKETQQHEHSTNTFMCMWILGVAIVFVVLKLGKVF